MKQVCTLVECHLGPQCGAGGASALGACSNKSGLATVYLIFRSGYYASAQVLTARLYLLMSVSPATRAIPLNHVGGKSQNRCLRAYLALLTTPSFKLLICITPILRFCGNPPSKVAVLAPRFDGHMHVPCMPRLLAAPFMSLQVGLRPSSSYRHVVKSLHPGIAGNYLC